MKSWSTVSHFALLAALAASLFLQCDAALPSSRSCPRSMPGGGAASAKRSRNVSTLIFGGLVDWIETAAEDTENLINSQVEATDKLIEDVGNDITNFFQDGKLNEDLLRKRVEELVEEMKEDFKAEFIVGFEKAYQETQSRVKSAVSDVKGTVKTYVDDPSLILEDATDLVLELTDELLEAAGLDLPEGCKDAVKGISSEAYNLVDQCARLLPGIPDLVKWGFDSYEGAIRGAFGSEADNPDNVAFCAAVRQAVNCTRGRARLEREVILGGLECINSFDLFDLPSVECIESLYSVKDSAEMLLSRSFYADAMCIENELREGELCLTTMSRFAREHSDIFDRCMSEFNGESKDCSDDCRELAPTFREEAGCCLTGFNLAAQGIIKNMGNRTDFNVCGTDLFSCDKLDEAFADDHVVLPQRDPNPTIRGGGVTGGGSGNGNGGAVESSSGLSGGAAAGITLTVLLIVGAAAAAAYFYVYLPRTKKHPAIVVSNIGSPSPAANPTAPNTPSMKPIGGGEPSYNHSVSSYYYSGEPSRSANISVDNGVGNGLRNGVGNGGGISNRVVSSTLRLPSASPAAPTSSNNVAHRFISKTPPARPSAPHRMPPLMTIGGGGMSQTVRAPSSNAAPSQPPAVPHWVPPTRAGNTLASQPTRIPTGSKTPPMRPSAPRRMPTGSKTPPMRPSVPRRVPTSPGFGAMSQTARLPTGPRTPQQNW